MPKYIAGISSLDLPVCGRESSKVEIYSPDILRDGHLAGDAVGAGLDHLVVVRADPVDFRPGPGGQQFPFRLIVVRNADDDQLFRRTNLSIIAV